MIKRIVVAVIGVPLVLLVVYLGGWTFFAVVTALSSIALWEFYRITEKKFAYPHKILGIIAGAAMLFIVAYFHFFKAAIIIMPSAFVFIAIVLIAEMFSKKPNATLSYSVTVAGTFYISLSFSFLLALRNFANLTLEMQEGGFGSRFFNFVEKPLVASDLESAWFVVCVLASIWICDTAAYFIGSKMGKHKLFERVSPKKTVEGAVAGFVFAIVSFWAAAEILLPAFPLGHSLALGAIVGVVGQLGDLAESQFKRDAKVKDSSAILPGHGGLFDRFDSILFVMPATYFYLMAVTVF